MRLLLLLYLHLCIAPLIFAQNLVPNPSFEELSTCDFYFDEFDKVKSWKGYSFTPDLFNACCVTPYLRVPNNIFDNQTAATGKGYAGILTYHQDQKRYKNEIIGAKLLQKLHKGKKYRVSFKLSFAKDYSQYASNNIGLLFSNQPDSSYNSQLVHLNCSEVMDNSDVWQEISGVFLADQDYEYVLIGNFFLEKQTKLIRQEGGNFVAAYYFIDDVKVVETQESEKEAPVTIVEAKEEAEKIEAATIAISGKVYDAETKRPIVAKVEYLVQNTNNRKSYETDYVSGSYAFANLLSPPDFILNVSARNYYTITQYVNLDQGEKRLKKDFYLQPLRAGNEIDLPNIVFAPESKEILPKSYAELNKLIQVMRDNPTMRIQLSGFTDSENDLALARERAKAIRDYLEKFGQIERSRLSVEAYYQTEPPRYVGNAADESQSIERVGFKILN